MGSRIVKIGDSLALILSGELLDRTGITADTDLDVSTDGDVIVITPARSASRTQRLRSAMADADDRCGGVFRRLAK